MKLFFASDLHGCLPATKNVVEAYKASNADYLVLLGDVLNHGPRNPVPDGYNPPAVADTLNQYADEIIAVRGNCDSEVDQMLLDFPMMMDYAWVLLDRGQRLFLTHGHLYNAEKRPSLKKGDVIAHGHTHIPVAQCSGEQVVFNPGSVTFPRNGFEPSYGLYDNGKLSVVDFSNAIIVEHTLD
ncbi:phosphodiesterase [Vibrio tapetis subsp. quintayensis]|uniref:phosphodiesterase n=1 Tax=Vibrio tapetis TaxID=52443 RepID=UPI0025B3CAB1|nr:phosphodiesterase [Vibrio tapetis]MDN3682127.1 phosphodiesterase [Vibrio tapetis subsp. quintayensis]